MGLTAKQKGCGQNQLVGAIAQHSTIGKRYDCGDVRPTLTTPPYPFPFYLSSLFLLCWLLSCGLTPWRRKLEALLEELEALL